MSSDKNFTELFAVSQLLSDTLRRISWKIVVVGSCYRWFHGKLVFFRNLFSTHPLLSSSVGLSENCQKKIIIPIWHNVEGFYCQTDVLVYIFSNVLQDLGSFSQNSYMQYIYAIYAYMQYAICNTRNQGHNTNYDWMKIMIWYVCLVKTTKTLLRQIL